MAFGKTYVKEVKHPQSVGIRNNVLNEIHLEFRFILTNFKAFEIEPKSFCNIQYSILSMRDIKTGKLQIH